MAEITTEYLDQKFGEIKTRFDKQTEEINLRFNKQTEDLKKYTHESFEAQQPYMEERFREITDALDVRAKVETLEKGVEKIKEALHIT